MLLGVQKVKEIYGISRRTLINWEKEGLIKPLRTPKGRRRCKKEDIEKLLGMIEVVKNPNVRKRQLKEIDWAIKLLQSPVSEPKRVSEPLDGTSSGVCGDERNLWRVLRVAVVTPLSPDRVLRDMSVLKSVLISGQVGGPLQRREFLFPGTGAMVVPLKQGQPENFCTV